jgi:hypothetical protein
MLPIGPLADRRHMMYDVTIMHRTQLLLEEWQYEALKAMAESEGRSLSSVVRDILARHLRGSPRRKHGDVSDIEGLFSDGEASGRDHDRHLHRGPGRRGKKRRP